MFSLIFTLLDLIYNPISLYAIIYICLLIKYMYILNLQLFITTSFSYLDHNINNIIQSILTSQFTQFLTNTFFN